MSHRWPGVNHVTVWSMSYGLWLRYVAAAKEYVEHVQEQERKLASMNHGRG